MARYIDADELLKKLPDDLPYKASVKRVLMQAPTADVAPKSEVELLKRQLEPFKQVQCFTCKHYDIGHDHVPCCYCEDYDKYIWLSADADTDIHASNESEVGKGQTDVVLPTVDVVPKSEVAREIFEEIEKALNLSKCYGESGIYFEHDIEADIAELKKKYTEEKE